MSNFGVQFILSRLFNLNLIVKVLMKKKRSSVSGCCRRKEVSRLAYLTDSASKSHTDTPNISIAVLPKTGLSARPSETRIVCHVR